MFGISFSMLSDAQPSLKDCEITAGLWVHVAQYRKAVLAGVDCLWQVLLGETAKADRAAALAADLIPLCVLLPLAEIDLAKEACPIVAASDASEEGGGVRGSRGLTRRGRVRLAEASVQVSAKVADTLPLVEHCSGIGAGRRALELLGLRPGGHVATEVDEAAIKVMESCWPAVSMLGDLRD